MKKDVLISVTGIQQYVDQKPDCVKLVTEGTLVQEENRYILTYQESELTGLEGTQTTIQVEGDQVMMLREGTVNTQMVFQLGRRHFGFYHTPYGDLFVGVNPHHVMAELTAEGGEIELDYELELDHALVGRSILVVNVKEAEHR